jgi:N-acylneuraminate cytidylyltransferase
MEESKQRSVAFIPVRGGSKSIPRKNIKEIAGKPLVHWVLDAALESGMFDDVYVSTDDEEIKQVVLSHPESDRITVIGRSKEAASDTASTESAMLEFASAYSFDTITLLQATSPLTTGEDIRKAYRMFDNDADCGGVLSVCRQERFIWKESTGGYFKPENYDPASRPLRQDFDGFLVENGAIYITSRESLLKYKNRLSGNILCYEMSPDTYYEIDEPADWPIVEDLLKRRRKRSSANSAKTIKLFISDVDGVLTDAGMYYSEKGDELKKFNTRDGKGFELLRKQGVKTGIITTEDTKIVANRASKLKIDILHQGISEKGKLLLEITTSLGISPSEVAYIGDDINDLSIINSVGFSACPADAVEGIRSSADYICQKKGGKGCVREFAELILSRIDSK